MAGVYGWHFEQPPHHDLEAGRLLYVDIAPRFEHAEAPPGE